MAVAYEVLGPEGGAPVALVPGTFSDRRTWLKLAGSLSSSFRCLLFDPRGTGASPDPGNPFTPDDLVDDLLEAMDGAKIQDAHLVGHSLGAVVALLAAARHPARVRRLVAIGPTAWVDARLRMVLDHWESVVRSDLDEESVVRALVLDAFGRKAFERLVPAVVHDMLRNPIPRQTLQRYIDCNRRQDLRMHLGRVDAPVLVVAGTEDSLSGPVHARAVVEGVPGARLELVEGAGHTPQVERPAELARLVVPFLKGHRRRPATSFTLEAGTER